MNTYPSSSQLEIVINVISTSLSITSAVSFLFSVVRAGSVVKAGSTFEVCAFDVRIPLIAT